MQNVDYITKEIDGIVTGPRSNCRYECQFYDWSVGACTGDCEEYIKKKAKEIIKNHARDEEWIRVDDRLPEKRGYGRIKVWITIAYPAGNATRQVFFENGRFLNLNGSQIADKIIAWKPYQKPEPYQGNRTS